MLTKSDFLNYIQCKKKLWLGKHRKDLMPEVDMNKQAIFDFGNEVESYANLLFPEAVRIPASKDFHEPINNTKKEIEKKSAVIQPTVIADDLYCRGDIIKYSQKKKAWDIYEVKAGTSAKDINLYDLAFQKICFENAGIPVNKLYLIHINNEYIKKGEIKPEKLLKIEDVTKEVKALEVEAKKEIKEALKILKLSNMPEVRIIKQCKDPYECDFIPFCWKDIPEHSIYNIGYALGEDNINKLLDKNIIKVIDIPEEMISAKKKLRLYQKTLKKDQIYVEKENIKKELDKIEYPVHYLDYETYFPAVPIFDGYKPYQRIVFQYSLHIQDKPNGELKHFYYLEKENSDPTEELSKSLKKNFKKKGSVIAWNMKFEKGCNSETGKRNKKFNDFYENINNRMLDLMDPFKESYYVDKMFKASASLKNVLPPFIPELTYSNLEIQEGMTASNSWKKMIDSNLSKKEKEKIYKGLLNYCELDTLAMAKILEKLYNIIN